MAYGAGGEQGRYCWHCMAILPFKLVDEKPHCARCGNKIGPIDNPEEVES